MRMGSGLWSRLGMLKGAPLPPESKLGKDAITALWIHCCFQFGASMSGLFLNLYLWRLTQNLVVNGVYNITVFLVTPFAFALGGWIAKKRDRMVTYRLGIVMIAIFYFMVVIAQEQVAHYYIWFAIFNGFAAGFYWTGYLVIQYDVSTEANRIRFLAVNMIVFNTAGLAGPALAGFIIQRSEGLQGYIIIFTLAFIMFLIAALVSFRIPKIQSHHKAYYLRFMGLVMHKNKRWLKALYSFFILGLFQGIMLFLPNIMLFRTVGREDWVGYLGVFFSALTVATGYVISRKAQKEHVRKYVLLSTTGVALGASLLLIQVEFWSVAMFMILFSICNPLAVNTLTSYYYRLIGTLPLKGQLRVESVVMRELFLNVGRVVSITLLLVLAHDMASIWLPIVLFGMAVMQYVCVFLIQEKQNAENSVE
ncbi:YQGE family putative transporter [Paenibacillus castaneae]|uniref:MFS transporter n=1 Tax=Paenibacillus castaneae TaxID=474957 RepID=UPI000C99F3DC|nr:MFS transporter [Paenibacillus castaneae]NIK74939.1 YQGE family putative transporter [Paenibacillus castaneae]